MKSYSNIRYADRSVGLSHETNNIEIRINRVTYQVIAGGKDFSRALSQAESTAKYIVAQLKSKGHQNVDWCLTGLPVRAARTDL